MYNLCKVLLRIAQTVYFGVSYSEILIISEYTQSMFWMVPPVKLIQTFVAYNLNKHPIERNKMNNSACVEYTVYNVFILFYLQMGSLAGVS